MKLSKPAVPHYQGAKIEPIDLIAALQLDFFSGNIIKYVCRAGRKEGAPALEDYKKARQYLDWLIEMEQTPSELRQVAYTYGAGSEESQS